MKKTILYVLAFTCLMLSFACVAGAQVKSPVKLTEAYDFKKAKIAEISDVKPVDEFYPALKDLVENYGISFGFTDGKFHGDQPLTRGAFVIVLDDVLKTIRDKYFTATKGYPLSDDKREMLMPSGFSLSNEMVSDVDNIADVKERDPFHGALYNLTEFTVSYVEEDKKFHSEKAVSYEEFFQVLKQMFGATANFNLPQRNVTRAEVTMIFDQLLNKTTKDIDSHVVAEKKAQEEIAKQLPPIAPNAPKVKIVNWQKAYLGKNLGTCFNDGWASALEDKMGGSDGWRGYVPGNGQEGYVVRTVTHCKTQAKILIIRVQNNYLPIEEKGVEFIK